MSWYRGQWTHGHNTLAWWLWNGQQDYRFIPVNMDKVNTTVVAFIHCPLAVVNKRVYASSKYIYQTYQQWCTDNHLTALSSWQFKHNMQLLGFPYLKSKRFYKGYGCYPVTTAFNYIGIKRVEKLTK